MFCENTNHPSGIPGWRQAGPTLFSSGQPEARHWPALAAAGIRSVVNLRPRAELPGRDEPAEVAVGGLAYASIPVADAGALSRDAALAFVRALRELPSPVLVHCATGNRVGALVALREAWFAGADAPSALDRGVAAGLGSLATQIRRQLGLPDLA